MPHHAWIALFVASHVHVAVAAAIRTPSSCLAASSTELAHASTLLADVAVLLQESQEQAAPRELSGSLAAAAQELKCAAHALSEGDWPAAADPIGQAGTSFALAAAFLEELSQTPSSSAGFVTAAAELADAASVTGCIALAAAAGPNLQFAGEALGESAGALLSHGATLIENGETSVRQATGGKLCDAARAMQASALSMCEAGIALEGG